MPKKNYKDNILYLFLSRLSLKKFFSLLIEEYGLFLFRNFPSWEGILIRRLVYKLCAHSIGKSVLICKSVFLDHAYGITIGNCVSINSNAHIDGRGGVIIGDYCLIGPHVFIGSSNHIVDSFPIPGFIASTTPKKNIPRFFAGNILHPVNIGRNVWIGANAVIVPGINIGENSIIAAGSVVTKDVMPNTLVGGNPAAIIRAINTEEKMKEERSE